jgi:hypothetical protein
MRESLGITDAIHVKMNDVPKEIADAILFNIPVKGLVKAKVIAEDGSIKEEREFVPNLITDNGKYGITDQILASPTLTKPTHMGIGTGTTAAASGQTALVTETGTRVAFDSKTRSTNVVTMVATFPAGNGTAAITEAGIFTAVTSGTMWARVVFAAINKGASDSLQLTWTWTIG